MVLFGESTGNQIKNILYCLNKFCVASGTKVSVQKTKIYFSKNTSPCCNNEISEMCGFEKVTNLGKYLGMPIIHG